MALVSGGRSSSLNPNAPLFIPAAVRQVEDFSPEWWQLVTTSTWFHDYWVSQHMGEDGFYENEFDGNDDDIAAMLPDTIDLGILDDDFDEFIHSSRIQQGNVASFSTVKGISENGNELDEVVKKMSLLSSSNERSPRFPIQSAKYWEKPAKPVSPKSSNRHIQQPR